KENAAKFKGVVGAFEGAGYTAKGLYRPMFDCIMFSRSDIPFCTVCEDTISRMIKYYTK
ncbi:MAG: peptidase M64, partial [bacterium]|nr:peptidase M64 [bacterium]